MPEILIALVLISSIVAVWAFRRALKLHHRIEDHHPGFNEFMRKGWKRRRRR
jgi:hypothetical protein